MKKRIFTEEEPTTAEIHQPKREFMDAQVEPEMPEIENQNIIQHRDKPSRFWIRLLLSAVVLFGCATLAQSIQWLVDTFYAKQWINFAFAIAFLGVSLAGLGSLISEWRKLHWLRKFHQRQQEGQQLWLGGKSLDGEAAVKYGRATLSKMKQTPLLEQAQQRWESQLDEAYNSQEVLYLFSENVLKPIDKQVKKLISQSAAENAIIVAVSPLAIVDVLMMAWRNIALVNKITQAYGMELGYFSRLRLFRMVLTNMVFAGATEIASDIGMDFFSQNLTAKLSIRMAQGIGAGLLTARLGIKAMEFCRPLAFTHNERPRLSVVRQELLGVLKERVFRQADEKVREGA